MNNCECLLDEFDFHDETTSERFTLNEKVLRCKCLRVKDGDTIVMLMNFKNNIVWTNARLMFCDAPEIHTENPKEKEQGYVCKTILEHLILDKTILAVFGDPSNYNKDDKYGRQLSTIWIPLDVKRDPDIVCGLTTPKTKSVPRYIEVNNVTEKLLLKSYEEDSIFIEGMKFINVNRWMVDNTDTCYYTGGKKQKYDERVHKCLGVFNI